MNEVKIFLFINSLIKNKYLSLRIILLSNKNKFRDQIVEKDLLYFFKFIKNDKSINLAAKKGSLKILDYLYKKNYSVNFLAELGNLMFKAVKYNHLNIIKYLLSKGAKLNLDYLKIAVRSNYFKIVDFIFSELKPDPTIYLNLSAKKNYINLVKYFFRNNGVISRKTLVLASRNNNLKLIKFIVSELSYITDEAFYVAAESGCIDIVKFFHKKGKIIDNTILERASNQLERASNQPKIIKYLIQNGINLKITDRVIDAVAFHGDLEFLKYLWSFCDPALFDCYKTAIKEGFLDIIEFLYEKGIKLDWSLLDTAAEYDNLEAIIFFYNKGYDLYTAGLIMMEHAVRNKNIEIIKFLNGIGIWK